MLLARAGWGYGGGNRARKRLCRDDNKDETPMKLDSSIAAVVTGGASGLGEATVRALAAQGVKVAIFDMNAAKGEAVAAEVGGVF
jgi:ribulose 1,5-bisphosphate synthetase/thiazole synthase